MICLLALLALGLSGRSSATPPSLKGRGPSLVLRGHVFSIYSIAFSPDGKLLASASNGQDNGDRAGEVKVWDLKAGREIHSLRGHEYGVWRIAFSPGGKRLASAGKDDVIKIWDVRAGKVLFTLKGHTDDVYGVAWAPDGRSLASCSEDRTDGQDAEVRLWETATGRLRWTTKLRRGRRSRARTFAVAFSPDGKCLATANEYGVALLNPATGKEVASLGDDLTFGLAAVAFSPDGKRLAAAGLDETVCVWEVATGQQLLRVKDPGGRVIYRGIATVAFSPDGRRLASTSQHRLVKVWDLGTGKVVRTLSADGKKVTSVAFSPDGKRLAAAGTDRVVRVWDVSDASRQGW